MKTIVFGDIEGDQVIYESTMRCISESSPSSRFIFLGDIYSSDFICESITMIETIIKKFYEIKEIFNRDSTEIDVIRAFRKIWKEKNLKAYKTVYTQYWRTVPKQNKDNNQRNFKVKFLFGNKEIEFLYDLLNSKNISKSTLDNDCALVVPVKYINSQTKKELEDTHTYTFHQLNVMYTYLSYCSNYHLEGSTLFTHCYFNCGKMQNIKTVISGHNKGYGKFMDQKHKDIVIYLVDLTYKSHEQNINNFIIQQGNEYELCNQSHIPDGLTTIKPIYS